MTMANTLRIIRGGAEAPKLIGNVKTRKEQTKQAISEKLPGYYKPLAKYIDAGGLRIYRDKAVVLKTNKVLKEVKYPELASNPVKVALLKMGWTIYTENNYPKYARPGGKGGFVPLEKPKEEGGSKTSGKPSLNVSKETQFTGKRPSPYLQQPSKTRPSTSTQTPQHAQSPHAQPQQQQQQVTPTFSCIKPSECPPCGALNIYGSPYAVIDKPFNSLMTMFDKASKSRQYGKYIVWKKVSNDKFKLFVNDAIVATFPPTVTGLNTADFLGCWLVVVRRPDGGTLVFLENYEKLADQYLKEPSVLCNKDEYFNPVTGRCEPIPQCGPGMQFNKDTGKCEKITCPEGYIYDPSTNSCVQPPSLQETETGITTPSFEVTPSEGYGGGGGGYTGGGGLGGGYTGGGGGEGGWFTHRETIEKEKEREKEIIAPQPVGCPQGQIKCPITGNCIPEVLYVINYPIILAYEMLPKIGPPPMAPPLP